MLLRFVAAGPSQGVGCVYVCAHCEIRVYSSLCVRTINICIDSIQSSGYHKVGASSF